MTPFRQVVCWQPSAVNDVLVSVAARPSDAVFLATHQPVRMWTSPAYLQPTWRLSNEQAFLQSFLDPDAEQVFVPIIGASGSGKSHLIRWLDTQIPRTSTRRVVNIPKHETNLRGVIHLILDGLEGDIFTEFRTRLTSAAGTLTREGARWDLLTNLTFQIETLTGKEQIHDGTGLIPAAGLTLMQQNLPSFLLEEVVRTTLNRPDSVIDRFVTEALTGRSDDKTSAFQITVNDLPLNLKNIAAASAKVRGFYGQLVARKDLQRWCVALINHFLPAALQSIYQLSGDDLLTLMRDVRKVLAGKQELVLLVEDFALLQGIQTPLLEAFIDDQRDGLCRMRVALAVTSGYFKHMDTVHTRMTTVVTLDEPDNAAAEVPWLTMTGAYLNAARWGAGTLDTQPRGEVLESKCISCRFRSPCHAAFGTVQISGVDGSVGLYPLNADAAYRVASEEMKTGFNPRFLLRGLRETLQDAQGGLPLAAFPTPVFAERYAAPQNSLPIDVQADLTPLGVVGTQIDAVLRVWRASETTVAVPAAVAEAFGIRGVMNTRLILTSPTILTSVAPPEPRQPDTNPIATIATSKNLVSTKPAPSVVSSSSGPATAPGTTFVPIVTQPVPPPPPAVLPPMLQNLQDWAQSKEKVLTQGVTKELRELVYDLLNERLNWTALGIDEGILRSERLWSADHIYFADQMGTFTPAAGAVKLSLPGDESRPDVALVLSGLWTFKQSGHWPAQPEDLPWRAAASLDHWQASVAEQLQIQPGWSNTTLDLAVRMLTLNVLTSGRLPAGQGMTAVNIAPYLLGSAAQVTSSARPHHRALSGVLTSGIPDALKQLAAYAMVRKSSDGLGLVLDFARLKPLIEGALSGSQGTASVPHDRLNLTGKLHDAEATLQKAVGEWRAMAAEALLKLETQVGAQDPGELADTLVTAFQAALATGTLELPVNPVSPQLWIEGLLQDLRQMPLHDMVTAFQRVHASQRPLETAATAAAVDWERWTGELKTLTALDGILQASYTKTAAKVTAMDHQQTSNVIRDLREGFTELMGLLNDLSGDQA